MPVKIAPEDKILYRSTNSPKDYKEGMVDFKTAMLNPEIPDKGLYVPERIPTLPDSLVKEFGKMNYPEVAYHVLRAWFTEEEVSDRKLRNMMEKTYTFAVDILPFGDDYCADFGVCPTLSFKDKGTYGSVALIEHFAEGEILTDFRFPSTSQNDLYRLVSIDSTSGDTGPSNAGAMYKKPVIVIQFFPYITPEFQRRQMSTLEENIYAFPLKTDFDGCQQTRDRIMERLSKDPRAKDIKIVTGNSKVISRFLCQIPYWFYISSKVCEESGSEKVNAHAGFGNGSNFTTLLYAERMGAPVDFMAAISNDNTVFPDFIETGEYRPREAIECWSMAMVVGNPSNAIRAFDLYGGNLDRNGIVHKQPDMDEIRKKILSVGVSNEENELAIKYNYEKYKDVLGNRAILDPHGGVANWGMHKLKASNKILSRYANVFTKTASEVKFPDLIRKAIGIEPELPEHYKDIYERKERVFIMEPDLPEIEKKVYELLSI